MVHLSSNLSDLIPLEMVVLGSELECTDLVVVDWDRTASDGYLETNPERYRPIHVTFLGTAVAGTRNQQATLGRPLHGNGQWHGQQPW